MTRRQRFTRQIAAALGCSLTLGMVMAIPGVAHADDVPDISSMSVAQLEVELARIQSHAREVRIDAQRAAEDYAQTQDDLDKAKEASEVAKSAAKKARDEYSEAQQGLASIAQTVYRSGGGFDAIAPFIKADGLADVERRTSFLKKFTHNADFQMQQVAALDQVARTLEKQADEAQTAVQAAADRAKQQLDDVRAAADQADREVANVEQRRSALIAQLAEKRNVSVAEETRRQSALEAQQQARSEAAARARVEAAGSQASQAESARQAEAASRAEAERRQAEEARKAQEAAEAEAARRRAAEEEARRAAEEEARRQASQNSGAGARALAWAATRVGAPYVWGGTGPGYDCSGLVYMAFANAGVSLPRTADYQYWATRRVAIADLQPGDLVFWGDGGAPSEIYHVAFYAGNGQILESPKPGEYVRYAPLRYYDLVPYGGRV